MLSNSAEPSPPLPSIEGIDHARDPMALAPLVRPATLVLAVGLVFAAAIAAWVWWTRRRDGVDESEPVEPTVRRSPIVTAGHGCAIALLTVWVASVGGAFSEIAPGSDTWGHLAKMQLIARDWPNVSWNASWYSGAPYFAGSYPPGYHAAVMGTGRVLGISDPRAMHVVAMASLCAITVGVAATAWAVTGRRWTGWVAAVFALASGTVWSYPLSGAVHPRVMALGASMVALAATTALVAKRTRARWCVAVIALAVAGSAHLFVAAFGFMLVGGVAIVGRLGERFRTRLRRVVAVCAPAVLIDAYFYVPMLAFTGAGGQVSADGRPAPWSVLFGNELVRDGLLRGFPPMMVVLGLALVGGLVVRSWARRFSGPRVLAPLGAMPVRTRPAMARTAISPFGPPALARAGGLVPPPPMQLMPVVAPRPGIPGGRKPPRPVRDLHTRMAWGLLIGLSVCLVYAFAGHFATFQFYVLGMHAVDLMVVPALVLPVAVAILAGSFVDGRSRTVERWVAVVCLAPALLGLVALVPQLDDGRHLNRRPDLRPFQLDLPDEARGSLRYRLTTTDDAISRPLNVVDPLAQTRGYQANAVTQPEYQYLIETGMVSLEPGIRRALFRWWSIGTVYALPGQVSTLSDDTETLRPAPTPSGSDLIPYEVVDPLPTMWSADTRTTLVIGDDFQRLRIFRLLVRGGWGPEYLMPLHGPERLDQLDTSELAAFDSIVVLGQVGEPTREQWAALDAWVNAGGDLFIEGVGSRVRVPTSATDVPAAFPDPMPISSMTVSSASTTWRFEQREIGGESMREFDAPDWNGTGLWETRVPGGPKSWATPILINRGVTLMVGGERGKGSVVWSGLNLAYHADAFSNLTESRVLFHLLGLPERPGRISADGPGLIDNQHARLTSSAGDRGVFMAQNSSPNWHVLVDGVRATAHRAGPEFVWVPLPDDGAIHVVELTYRMSGIEHHANRVSLLALGGVLGVAIVPRRLAPTTWWGPRRRLTRSAK